MLALQRVSVPNRPAARARSTASTEGLKRRLRIAPSVTPARPHAAAIASIRAVETSSGYSTKTCLPAAAASSTPSKYVPLGVATVTISIDGSASSSPMLA